MDKIKVTLDVTKDDMDTLDMYDENGDGVLSSTEADAVFATIDNNG